jgi:translation initiation factor 2 beta subunit (eIF-2beta)/eIF-5
MNPTQLISEGNVRSVNKRSSAYQLLKDNINTIGMETPITYRVNDKNENVVVNGHQRLAIAKELKMETVPTFKMIRSKYHGKIDDVTRQLSSNMFTVDMDLLDASEAVKMMFAENPEITRKEIQRRFGMKSAWIQDAINLTNLHPVFSKIVKTNAYDTTTIMEYLLGICLAPINVQEENLIEMFGNDIEFSEKTLKGKMTAKDVKQIVDFHKDEDFKNFKNTCDSINDEVNDNWRKNFFVKMFTLFDKKTFLDYQKEMGKEPQYTYNMFEEYADEYYCEDDDFLADFFVNKTLVGATYFKSVPIDKDIHRDAWEKGHARLEVSKFKNKQTFRREISLMTNNSIADIDIIAWDGRLTNPTIKYKHNDKYIAKLKKEKSNNSEIVKDSDAKDIFQSSYNKVNKLITPILFEYVENQIDPYKVNEYGMNIVVKWLNELMPLTFYAQDNNECDNNKFLNDLAKKWLDRHTEDVTIHQLDELFALQSQLPIKTYLSTMFRSNDDFKESYLKCFSLDALQTLESVTASNKKSAIKEAMNLVHMPFIELLGTVSGQSSQGLLKEYIA